MIHDNEAAHFIAVVVLRPLYQRFIYAAATPIASGMRVRVPFGARDAIGITVATVAQPKTHFHIKKIRKVLDNEPVFDATLLRFLQYTARYYQVPEGTVFAAALPNALLNGASNKRTLPAIYRLTEKGRAANASGKKQQAVLHALTIQPLSGAQLRQTFSVSAAWLNDLVNRGWLEMTETFIAPPAATEKAPTLNAAQNAVLQTLITKTTFSVTVLDGVTGSGKTEIYWRWAELLLAAGKQICVLLPEIGLAMSIFARFRARFSACAVYHSEMSEAARLSVWQAVKAGDIKMIVGTRSALFLPFCRLGAIIVDEAHDQSYKQSDQFRYHAADMAVVRAKQHNIPILLGSATPTLEHYQQTLTSAWQLLHLPERALTQHKPSIVIDEIEPSKQIGGLSQPLISAIRQHLQREQQILLFLNRRGYAPVMRCRECSWESSCTACDTMMTVHTFSRQLICHHCGRSQLLPVRCPKCASTQLYVCGLGTQRLEQTVREQFPQARVLRIDRDVFSTAKQFQQALKQIHSGAIDVMIGTQWLAKGHHFPRLQLVAVVDADSAFYSSDFRAEERLAQLLVQVGGRAGREQAGTIWIQTQHAQHPIFSALSQPYFATAQQLLTIRQQAQLPPFSAQTLFWAQHHELSRTLAVLTSMRDVAQKAEIGQTWQWLGPIPALIARKDGKYRAQMVVQAPNKKVLQRELAQVRALLWEESRASGVKVGIDVDPLWFD